MENKARERGHTRSLAQTRDCHGGSGLNPSFAVTLSGLVPVSTKPTVIESWAQPPGKSFLQKIQSVTAAR